MKTALKVHLKAACLTIVLAWFCLWAAGAENIGLGSEDRKGLYDPDPKHLWNRLHQTLLVRAGPDGGEYGFDELDPLLWDHTKHLLVDPSYKNTLEVLDEFLNQHGDALVRDPIKRAMLQRDLWAVFDWTARWAGRRDAPNYEARCRLQTHLATIIRRVALTKEEAASLSDNYSAAVRSGEFPRSLDQRKPLDPFLPPDLFATNGPWICVGMNNGEPLAQTHRSQFSGRSVFLIFMQTPGGRADGTSYLKQLRDFPQPWVYRIDTNIWINAVTGEATSNQTRVVANSDLPQFSPGTTFALVRQALLIDQDGDMIPSRLVESVQIRRYNDVHPKRGAYGMTPAESQSMFEFRLSRKRLFAGRSGGLRALMPDEKGFLQFLSKGIDPFEIASLGSRQNANAKRSREFASHPLLDCRTCHSGPGLQSVNSFLQNFQSRGLSPLQLWVGSVAYESDATIHWKEHRFNWGLLQGLWREASRN